MTTLREAAAQALDALTKIHPGNMSWETGDAWLNAVQILREALAQLEAEPLTNGPIGEVAIQDTQYHGYAMAIKPHIKDALPEGTKLYTTPPQREPLTDEEIDKVTDAQWAQNNHKPIYAAHRAYARAIEQEHGIEGEQ